MSNSFDQVVNGTKGAAVVFGDFFNNLPQFFANMSRNEMIGAIAVAAGSFLFLAGVVAYFCRNKLGAGGKPPVTPPAAATLDGDGSESDMEEKEEVDATAAKLDGDGSRSGKEEEEEVDGDVASGKPPVTPTATLGGGAAAAAAAAAMGGSAPRSRAGSVS